MKRRVGRILLLVPSLLWVGAVLYFEGVYLFFAATLAAAFHECGHLLAFSALGLPPPRAVAVARGIRLSAACPMSYRQELVVALSGPLANLACYLITLLTGELLPFAREFGEACLAAAVCNLVPLGEMDGERILMCLLSPRLTARTVYLVGQAVGGITLFFGVFLSLGLLWQTGEGTYPALLALAALLTQPVPSAKTQENGRI